MGGHCLLSGKAGVCSVPPPMRSPSVEVDNLLDFFMPKLSSSKQVSPQASKRQLRKKKAGSAVASKARTRKKTGTADDSVQPGQLSQKKESDSDYSDSDGYNDDELKADARQDHAKRAATCGTRASGGSGADDNTNP